MDIKTMELNWVEKGSFPVIVAQELFSDSDAVTATVLKQAAESDKPRILLVADANVVQRTPGIGTRIGRYIQTNNIALVAPPIILAGGEKIKNDNMQSVQKVMLSALNAKVGKHDVVVALGGGTVLDVAGYAAAQVRGGVGLVRIPTTIAAMAEGSFSTTAGIDSANVKDALRVPSRPVASIVDPAFSATILDGVWRGGIGEIIRHAAVRNTALLKRIAQNAEKLRDRDMALMSELVRDAVISRAERGGSDFALWCAERLEAMSGYKLPHGYAVPIGICIDCAYAVDRGMLKESDQELICRALADSGALDGLSHSRHLIAQIDSVLRGLDAWRLATGSESRTLAVGSGKGKAEAKPDRDAYRKVIKEFNEASAEGDEEAKE